MRCRPLLVLAAWGWLSPSVVQAQQPPTSPASEQSQAPTPTFRTDTSAVVLDVVVRDRSGRPVTDLRADEITVLEGGQAVPVQTFGFVRGASPPRTPGDGPDPLRRTTLITLVFDHLSQNGRDLARRAASEFLSRDLPPDQWVSIYRLENRLHRAQAFTRDPVQIRAGIEAATRGGGRESTDGLPVAGSFNAEGDARAAEAATRQIGSGGAIVDTAAIGAAAGDAAVSDVLERMSVMIDRAQVEQRGQSSMYPLMSLVKAHGTLDGRKALLFFSEGLVVPPSLEEAFRAVVSEANRANVSVYAIDARGLDPARSLEQARLSLERSARNSQRQLTTRGGAPVTIEDVMNAEHAEASLRQDTQGTLQMLAEETGGFLVANANDLAAGLARVGSDLESYYEIAYLPREVPLDGRFRTVDVRVARRGVTVQSRSGYFALPPTDGAPLLPYELPMLAAATASPLPMPFQFAAAVFRFGTGPLGTHHTVVVEVPLEHLTFEEDRRQKKYQLRFTVMALVRNASGEVVERLSDAFPLEGPLERLPALRTGRLVFRRQLWLQPGQYSVLAVARDQHTERSSVRAVRVDVPVATPDMTGISTVALIRRVEPTNEAPDAFDDPFRTDQLRIIPSLDVPISRASNTQFSAYVVVYPGGDVLPELTFEFVRDGVVLGRSAAELPLPDEAGTIKYVATFPTAPFEPGTYTLRATVRDRALTHASDTTYTIVP